MALSNRERQTRHRDRLKELAAVGELKPMVIQMLATMRTHIREWKRSIALCETGIMRTHTNDVDDSADYVAHLRQIIDNNQSLLEHYDPKGLTRDGNVELAEVPKHLIHQLFKDRPVTYQLKPDGTAVVVRAFETLDEARMHAAGASDTMAGVVAHDTWSLMPDAD